MNRGHQNKHCRCGVYSTWRWRHL